MVFGQFDLDLHAGLMKGTGPTLSDRLHHYKVPAEATRDWSDDLVQICLEDRLLERSGQVAARPIRGRRPGCGSLCQERSPWQAAPRLRRLARVCACAQPIRRLQQGRGVPGGPHSVGSGGCWPSSTRCISPSVGIWSTSSPAASSRASQSAGELRSATPSRAASTCRRVSAKSALTPHARRPAALERLRLARTSGSPVMLSRAPTGPAASSTRYVSRAADVTGTPCTQPTTDPSDTIRPVASRLNRTQHADRAPRALRRGAEPPWASTRFARNRSP